MTAPVGALGRSRRAALASSRRSRRPSRLGTPAGAAPGPDYVHPAGAGFAGLLARVWRRATAEADLAAALQTLLTLDGHVPAEVQYRALRTADGCALRALCHLTWHPDGLRVAGVRGAGRRAAFHGELGLTTGGRVVLRVPSRGPLASEHDLVDGVLRVPWPARVLLGYRAGWQRERVRQAQAVADCRQWLAAQPRDELLGRLTEAALRTAPFVLYQEDTRYTNFRDRSTITGRTLWPGHPDCAFSSLAGSPLDLWPDSAVLMVVCLTLLVRSGGFARVEEANGTQLTLGWVAGLLERTRRQYNKAGGGRWVAPAAPRVAALGELATALSRRRRELGRQVQLYREVHGALLHKTERIAGPVGDPGRARERAVCAHLRADLPLRGATLDELGAGLAADPAWLAVPHGGFGTGLESLVHATVRAAGAAFAADFAMSRGIRSLPALVRALRAQDWAQIVGWEIAEYFCCVVPAPLARRHFGGSSARLADAAWAMSARMQYNSWHFIAGNLPAVPEVAGRDYFVPPVVPDLAQHGDLHHHGHVAAHVRHSIRSPQAVTVLGRAFAGFVDLRLLRCDGEPFGEQDLLAAHRGSAFLARATELAAELVAGGADIQVTSFDPAWHWQRVTGEAVAAERAARP